ncbi:phage/plasmid primase, P4 family [Martelella sp. FLE1502]
MPENKKKKGGLSPEAEEAIAKRAAGRTAYLKNPDPLPVLEAEEEESVLDLSAEEITEECAALPETDIGNANRFLTRYGDRVRHVTHVGWHGFDGKRWLEDQSGAKVRVWAHRTAEMIDEEAISLDCSERERADIDAGRQAREEMRELGKRGKDWDAEKLAKFDKLQKLIDADDLADKDRRGRQSSRHNHAKSSAGSSKINNMLAEAAPYCSLSVQDLNTDLYALNTVNGTLRFFTVTSAAGKPVWQCRLDRHRSTDLISKLAEAQVFSDAGCPTFLQFLIRVMPDPDRRAFLQRYMGYCLLGLTGEQCLVFFYGAGRNGKSTFVDLMVEILGDYAVSMSIDSFAGDSRRGGAEATPDLARLPGARLVAASEPEMGVQLKDALIKTLTGGEPIAVRRLHQDFFELIPHFKIILSGNHKPQIRDDSDGIWRRVHLVPWEIQIPEEEVDRDLPRKLRQERDGVLAWMIKGALDYLQNGLQVPDSIRLATAEYREESDPIGAFLRNACDITGKDDDTERPDVLYEAYCRYASREGLSEFKKATFTKRLPDQTRKTWKGRDGMMHSFRRARSNGTVYYGIRIGEEWRSGGDGVPPPPNEDWPDAF